MKTRAKMLINHESGLKYIDQFQPELNAAEITDVIGRVIRLNRGLRDFWSSSHGWAPVEAAELLSRARLDWQVSLSACLNNWVALPVEEQTDGQLILAWANLGSLVEGSLKLFLSAFYENYKYDIDAIKKKGVISQPDGLMLGSLRVVFQKKIWDAEWNSWITHIQERRNAIHSFQDRDIGTFAELFGDIRVYLRLLRYLNFRLPYPDDDFKPRE